MEPKSSPFPNIQCACEIGEPLAKHLTTQQLSRSAALFVGADFICISVGEEVPTNLFSQESFLNYQV